MARVRSAILLIGLLIAAQPLAAQRVRVTLGETQTVGMLQSVSDTGLIINDASGSRYYSARNIRRLEQSAGRNPNVVTGFVGAVLGAAVGGALGCAVNSDSYGVFCGGQDDTKVIIGASLGGTVGAAAGAWLFRRERWQQFDAFARRAR